MPHHDKLVCPDCGHDEFTRDAPAVLRITVELCEGGCETELREETIDTDRDGDYSCDDCGREYMNADELVTQEVYNAGGDDD